MRALLAALLLTAAPALACDWYVASLGSVHYGKGSAKDYEQHNWGLGCEVSLSDKVDFAAGFYRNSIRIDSTYVGVVYAPFRWGPVRLGTAALLVSGYEKEPTKALIPVAALELGRVGMNVLVVPPTKANVGALGWQLKVRF